MTETRDSPSRYINSLAEKRRAREASEAAERASAAAGNRGKSAAGRGRNNPLKAFSEVQPKVRTGTELFGILACKSFT